MKLSTLNSQWNLSYALVIHAGRSYFTKVNHRCKSRANCKVIRSAEGTNTRIIETNPEGGTPGGAVASRRTPDGGRRQAAAVPPEARTYRPRPLRPPEGVLGTSERLLAPCSGRAAGGMLATVRDPCEIACQRNYRRRHEIGSYNVRPQASRKAYHAPDKGARSA